MNAARESIPHRRYPCSNCPWRRDTLPGEFTRERYEALADTTGAPGREAPIGAPMFACHKSVEGREEVCAGWLAAAGHEHLGVRLAVATGRLPQHCLTPGVQWPDLFDTYEEMANTQAREGGACPFPDCISYLDHPGLHQFPWGDSIPWAASRRRDRGVRAAVSELPRPLWPPARCKALGRCPLCGWHLEKQGHHELCPNGLQEARSGA